MSATAAHRATLRPTTEIRPHRGIFDLDLASLWQYRELLYFMIWREIKIRYKQAALGIAWAVLQPVLTVLIFTVIFGMFARFPSDGAPYPVFAFAAVLPWTYFSEAVRRSATGLVADADLIGKIFFPRLILPLAMVATPLVDFVLGLGVLLGVMAWYGIWPTWSFLLVIPFSALCLVIALAISLWLAPLNVRYRDVMHTLPFMLQVWMFATPIVYPLSMIPVEWRSLYAMNPMVGVIEGFRWAILGQGAVDLVAIGVSLSVVTLLLAGGALYFRSCERHFSDVI